MISQRFILWCNQPKNYKKEKKYLYTVYIGIYMRTLFEYEPPDESIDETACRGVF